MTLTSSPVRNRILNEIVRYKYLSIAQLVCLGAGDEKSVRTRLQDLVTAKLVDRQEFRLGPSAGRLPNIHWLTTKGAKFFTELTGEPAQGTRSRELNPSHAWHRLLLVDSLIAVDQWAKASGQSQPQFSTYMQRQGDSSPTSLKLADKNAEADGIFRLVDTAGNERVYVLEVYCSRYSEGQSSFSRKQLEPYILAGGEAFDEQLGIAKDGKGARVLIVCDTVDLRDRLLRTLPKSEGMPPLDRKTWQRLHFKAAEDLKSFSDNWCRVDGGRVTLPI